MRTNPGLIFIALLLLFTVGCGDDDPVAEPDNPLTGIQAELVGNWLLGEVRINGEIQSFPDDPCKLESLLAINRQQMAFTTFEGVDCDQDSNVIFIYSVNGQQLELSGQAGSIVLTINELEASEQGAVLDFSYQNGNDTVSERYYGF